MFNAAYTYHTEQIRQYPGSAEIPAGDIGSFMVVAALAASTDPENFVVTKQYMRRLESKYQVLFLILLTHSDHRQVIYANPEYADWFAQKDLQDSILA